MFEQARSVFRDELQNIQQQGLFKNERTLCSPQGRTISISSGEHLLNFCTNDYLGLANDPDVVKEAKAALDRYGYGLASVRFIAGTQTIHKALEQTISRFLGTEDTILYSSCFDANGGLFETILSDQDAVISDALNHASIIDGIRLCKAKRLRYSNGDMAALEKALQDCRNSRLRLIATDGVFSMDGCYAKLPEICALARRYSAMVMVDDSHATGFVGVNGRGTPEHFSVEGQIDIITSTLGKALGGASGGFTSGKKEVIALLRQRSRPYLFSNAVPPVVCGAALSILGRVQASTKARTTLHAHAQSFRTGMIQRGFRIPPGSHPIVPVMIGDARTAHDMADALGTLGIYVIGFSYPVVPKNQARIRVQLSAAHRAPDLERAMDAFEEVGKRLSLTPAR